MEKINFSFKKNNKYIINEKSINCIIKNNIVSFIIDNIKYEYSNNVLIKDTKDSKIIFDFINKNVTIILKDINKHLNILLTKVDIKNTKNNIKIEYIIETEKNTNNIISIEYTKSS